MSNLKFDCKKPCSNCPYRKDAPLQHWDIEEFRNLLKYENDYIGTVYQCHKKNGNICAGWMINQIENHFPSIQLRIKMMKERLTPSDLEKFSSPHEMYSTVIEMCFANFPELKHEI